ncbi:MAG: phosphotransferase [Bacteroidetes bacterium]|nr:phosphotransferase [Bacteroidota bacterium]
MNDNRIKTTLNLLCSTDYSTYVSGHLAELALFKDLNLNEASSTENIFCITDGRLSWPMVFSNKKNIHKVEEYFVVPSFANPRWIIPVNSSGFGQMVKPSSMKAKAALLIFKYLYVLHLGWLIFPSRIRRYTFGNGNISTHLSNVCNELNDCVSSGVIYLGSFGPLQKTTVEFSGVNGVAYYAKISDNNRAKDTLLAEEKALKFVNGLFLSVAVIPKCKGLFSIDNTNLSFLIQTPLNAANQCVCISNVLSKAITEIHNATLKHDIGFYFSGMKILERNLTSNEISFFNGLQLKIFTKTKDVHTVLLKDDKCKKLYLSYSHGDFTRWNINVDKKHAYIFDWEEAGFRPVGYDVFHFELIEYVLVHHQDEPSIFYAKLVRLFSLDEKLLEGFFCNDELLMSFYLKLYLVQLVDVYLWHAFVHNSELYPVKDNIDKVLIFACEFLNYLEDHKNGR